MCFQLRLEGSRLPGTDCSLAPDLPSDMRLPALAHFLTPVTPGTRGISGHLECDWTSGRLVLRLGVWVDGWCANSSSSSVLSGGL